MQTTESTVTSHYSTGDLMQRIESALARVGMTVSNAMPEQMAALDQFHIRGIEATKQLAELAGFSGKSHVLDVGSGIGGPARFLNTLTGCTVTGIDLTEEFVDVANALALSRGQSKGVRFVHGSALDMPFDDASFDGAWMQHANMNIEDKAGLFREVARVLKPGAKFVMHEIIADRETHPHFPVPWSEGPEGSFMEREVDMRQKIESAGFAVQEWQDHTQGSVEWARAMFAKVEAEGPPPLGQDVVLGPRFGAMAKNAIRSMDEGLIKVVMATAVRQP